MKKTKDIYINDDYKVWFKLDDYYCVATLLKRVTYFWGLLTTFTQTNTSQYLKFTFDPLKHCEKAEPVLLGRMQTGLNWKYFHIGYFNFKKKANELWELYDSYCVNEYVKSFEKEEISKLFES